MFTIRGDAYAYEQPVADTTSLTSPLNGRTQNRAFVLYTSTETVPSHQTPLIHICIGPYFTVVYTIEVHCASVITEHNRTLVICLDLTSVELSDNDFF